MLVVAVNFKPVIEPVEHIAPQLRHICPVLGLSLEVIENHAFGEDLVIDAFFRGDFLKIPRMQPVLEPGTPVVEGAFMFMERFVPQIADRFFKRIPLMEVELVGVSLEFRPDAFPGLFPIGFDISLSDRTENAFDDEVLSAYDLQGVQYVFSVL